MTNPPYTKFDNSSLPERASAGPNVKSPGTFRYRGSQ